MTEQDKAKDDVRIAKRKGDADYLMEVANRGASERQEKEKREFEEKRERALNDALESLSVEAWAAFGWEERPEAEDFSYDGTTYGGGRLKLNLATVVSVRDYGEVEVELVLLSPMIGRGATVEVQARDKDLVRGGVSLFRRSEGRGQEQQRKFVEKNDLEVARLVRKIALEAIRVEEEKRESLLADTFRNISYEIKKASETETVEKIIERVDKHEQLAEEKKKELLDLADAKAKALFEKKREYEETEMKRLLVAQEVKEAAQKHLDERLSWQKRCEEWVERESERCFKPFSYHIVRYVPRGNITIRFEGFDDYGDADIAREIGDDALQEFVQTTWTVGFEEHTGYRLIATPSGDVVKKRLGATLDETLVEVAEHDSSRPMAHCKTYGEAGYFVNVPPLAAKSGVRPKEELPERPEGRAYTDLIFSEKMGVLSMQAKNLISHDRSLQEITLATLEQIAEGTIPARETEEVGDAIYVSNRRSGYGYYDDYYDDEVPF